MRSKRLIAVAVVAVSLVGCTSGIKTGVSTSTSVSPATKASTPDTAPTGVATVSSLLTGTAHPVLPTLVSGKVAILFTAPPVVQGTSSTVVPVIVGNGTKDFISNIDVAGPAVDATGKVIGSGDSQGFVPTNVAPGQVSFGFAYFQSAIPAGSSFNLKVTYRDGESSTDVDAQVQQANAGTDPNLPSVVGTVTNPNKVTIKNPITANVVCFSAVGTLTDVASGFTSGQADLTTGATASFNDNIFENCPTFLVGASGYTF